MIREPLSPSDTSTRIVPAYTNPGTPPTAWAAMVFAALFLVLAVYHTFLTLRRKAWFTWMLIAASFTQCMSLVANAYDLSHPASTPWYALEGVVFPLAPTLIIIAVVQTYGRAAWHSVFNEPSQLLRFRGFLRWNTSVFITFVLFSYVLMLIGNIIAVATAPEALIVEGRNARVVRASYGIVEAGLLLQTIFLLLFIVLVWRWKSVSHDWEPEWDAVRRRTWTWKALLRTVLIGAGQLMLRQVYVLYRFFSLLRGLEWLHFVFDVLPLLATLIVLAVWHPGRCLPQELTPVRLNPTQLRSGSEDATRLMPEKNVSLDCDSEKQ